MLVEKVINLSFSSSWLVVVMFMVFVVVLNLSHMVLLVMVFLMVVFA